MTVEKTRTINLGENKGKPRIWLEGIWLHDLGFTRGAKFSARVTTDDGPKLIIRPDVDGTRTVSGKDKAGKPNPIIDLTGEWLAPFITAGRKLTIRQRVGLITITIAE